MINKSLIRKVLRKFKNDILSTDGWTFMEVLIVIAIIGVLSATVGFSVVKALERARIESAKTQIDTFTLALDSFYIDCGRYPTQDEGLDVLYKTPDDSSLSKKWMGPYLLKSVPKDPWGNSYVYRSPGNDKRDYEVFSYGADGGEGGQGKNADIKSWESEE